MLQPVRINILTKEVIAFNEFKKYIIYNGKGRKKNGKGFVRSFGSW